MSDIRVRLVPLDLPLLVAAVIDRSALEHVLGHEVAEGWEVFPGAVRRFRDEAAVTPDAVRWGPRLFVVDEPPIVVGWGGFKGPPRDGLVEIGYSVGPSWRGRGVATAAVRGLLQEAFAAPEVDAVLAHTRAEPGPSARVLEKTGFARVGEVPDESIGTAWRFRLDQQRVTHLEMTSVAELRLARVVKDLALIPIPDPGGGDFQGVISLHDRIAAAHLWGSLTWSHQRWRERLNDPTVNGWWICVADEAIGWGCLRQHPHDEVEIESFGIAPEHVGHGYGGYALTLLTQIAWTRGPGVRRVWLHTSTWDHPNALHNYLARGFRRVRAAT